MTPTATQTHMPRRYFVFPSGLMKANHIAPYNDLINTECPPHAHPHTNTPPHTRLFIYTGSEMDAPTSASPHTHVAMTPSTAHSSSITLRHLPLNTRLTGFATVAFSSPAVTQPSKEMPMTKKMRIIIMIKIPKGPIKLSAFIGCEKKKIGRLQLQVIFFLSSGTVLRRVCGGKWWGGD